MCLKKVYKTKPKAAGYGWKVFQKSSSDPEALRFSVKLTFGALKPGSWYTAEEITLRCNDTVNTRTYTSGFHIFLNRKDAAEHAKFYKEILRRVEYREAHTYGYGSKYAPGKQVIARQMRIVPAKGDSK